MLSTMIADDEAKDYRVFDQNKSFDLWAQFSLERIGQFKNRKRLLLHKEN